MRAVHILLLAALSGGASAQAADAMRGLRLYENHCTVCHESTVHIREQRKALNIAEVEVWVRRWSRYLNLPWSDDDVRDVVHYLNGSFYEFPPPVQRR